MTHQKDRGRDPAPIEGEFGPLPESLETAHEEISRLRADFATTYQRVGELAGYAGLFETNSVERLLDVLWAHACGRQRPDIDLRAFPLPRPATGRNLPANGVHACPPKAATLNHGSPPPYPANSSVLSKA